MHYSQTGIGNLKVTVLYCVLGEKALCMAKLVLTCVISAINIVLNRLKLKKWGS